MRFELLTGWRHIKSRRSKMLTMVSGITVLGVAFGVMALLVTLAVINGFKAEYEKSILAFNAHLIVMGGQGPESIQQVQQAIQGVSQPDEVKGVSPFMYREGLAVKGMEVRGIAIKAVDLESYWELSGLEHKDQTGDAGLWIGQALEKQLGVVGGILRLRVPEDEEDVEASRFIELPVSGTFATGIYDYDVSYALIDMTEARSRFKLPENADGVEIWLRDANQARSFQQRLAEQLAFPYTVMTWEDLNANLFGALQLERFVFAIIMGILILVASFNITGTLTMRILERRGDIAILRAMGARWKQLRRLFFCQGLVLGWTGCLLGVGMGLGLLEALVRFKPLRLTAEIYFIDFVPARWSPLHIGVALLVTTVFSWLATRIALVRLKKFPVVQALNEI